MRIPDPKANTTTEAYLAYKAGYLEESELKPVLYEPYLHFDAWLAYWAGLVPMYPIKAPGKNLFNKNDIAIGSNWSGVIGQILWPFDGVQKTRAVGLIPVKPNTTYTVTLASSEWYLMEINSVDNEFVLKSKISNINNNEYTRTLTTGEHICFLGFKFKYGSAGTATITKEMLSELKLQVELGDTATSYEDYTGEPEMLTDEEALVAYLSGVTNTYPEEIKDPYDVRIVGYLRHLVSARWPEPDYPVNNEEFYLSTMEPTHTSNPEPSSDIELDTAEGKIINVEAYGDTYQQTYSGANLFNNKTMTNKTISGDVTIIDDNSFTMYDDGTGGGWKYVAFEVGGITPNTDYSMKFTQVDSKGTSTNTWINVRPTGGSFIVNQTYASGTQIHFNSGEGTTSFIIQFYAQAVAGSVAANTATVSNIQLNVGNSTVAYEPYCGGIPAPNPDYPQDIDVVTGEQTVEVHGKNLFDKDNADILFGYINASGVIKQGGVDTDAMFYIPCSPNTTYTVQKGLQATTSKNRFRIGTTQAVPQYEDTVSDFWRMTDGSLDTIHTIVTSSNAKYLVVYCYGNDTEMTRQSLFDTVQVEQGSTATSYQPYQSQSYPISLTGKNLWNPTPYKTGYTINPSGVETVTTDGSIWELKNVSANTTYTIALKNNYVYGGNLRVHAYNSSGSWIEQVGAKTISANTSGSLTFTTPANTAFLRWGFWSDVSDAQLELGSTATPYAPYFTPIELCKIDDYQDYIYKNGADWYVHKSTGKMTSTSANLVQYQLNTYNKFTRPSNAIRSHPSVVTATSNMGAGVWQDQTWNSPIVGLFTHASGTDWWLGFGRVVTDEEAVEIIGKGCIIYYALATATNTKITDATLVGQLEALAGADTYNEKTYIKVTATDPNLPALLKVEAYKY